LAEPLAGAAFIAFDWGTTNRRAYILSAGGEVLHTERDELGVLSMGDRSYPEELDAHRARFGPLPVVAAGMVGSTRGWREAPYVSAPADIADLAASRLVIEEASAVIVPGVALSGARSDVMRGEEVQVLGAVDAGLAPRDALVCQPGTHNKWVRLEQGRIVDFATAMTGELFALLRANGIFAGMLDGPVADGAAFQDGMARGIGAVDLSTALFQARAEVVLKRRPCIEAAAFVSGILIGADVGSRGLGRGEVVHILANGQLAELYSAAVTACGARAIEVDSHQAFVAGIHRFWEMLN
jgi:2-dehydro-3-deoxygalactonokinase